MGTINAGKVRPVFKGTYSATTACNFFECWKYNDSWWLHIGVSPTTGTAPAEGSVWTAFGKKGDTGSPATITVGTVTTGAAGSSVVVTNGGTSEAVILNFTIPRGAKGDTGEGFSVHKTYASIALMNADAANVAEGKFVLIASTVEDEDNAKLYVKSSGSDFTYLTDMSGATGLKGEPGTSATITVGTVTTGAAGSQAAVVNAGDENNAQFNFTIPKGISITDVSINSNGELLVTTDA